MPISAKDEARLLARAKTTKADLMKRYRAGLGLKDIRKISGLSESSLSRLLRSQCPAYVADSRRWQMRRRRAFVVYVRCKSLRKTAVGFGVGFRTLSRWFKAMHPDYAKIVNQGTFASAASFLRREKNSQSAEDVEAWLLNQLPSLISLEADSPSYSYGDDVEKSQSKRDTSRYADYRNTLGERL